MDTPTADLLKKWNLEYYVDVFAAEGIDIATMLLLPKQDINTLIPKIGDRIRFETSLNMYRDDLERKQSTNCELDDLIDNIEDLFDENSKTPREPEASGSGGPTNSVRVILESSPEGRQVLEIGVKTGALPVTVRKRMCKLLLESLVTALNPVLPTDAQLLALSNYIGRLFSQESPPLYYAPYLPADAYQSKRNTSGWLVNARRARRAQLITLGLLAKPKSRSGSTSSTKSNPSLGIDLEALEEGDADNVASALEKLSRPCTGPWHSVSAIWRETARARLRYLYCEQGTLQEYMNKYPILQSPNGWRLLELDYNLLFPEKDGGLPCLEASANKIINLAKEKGLTSKDKFLRDRIAKELTNIDEAKPESQLQRDSRATRDFHSGWPRGSRVSRYSRANVKAL